MEDRDVFMSQGITSQLKREYLMYVGLIAPFFVIDIFVSTFASIFFLTTISIAVQAQKPSHMATLFLLFVKFDKNK